MSWDKSKAIGAAELRKRQKMLAQAIPMNPGDIPKAHAMMEADTQAMAEGNEIMSRVMKRVNEDPEAYKYHEGNPMALMVYVAMFTGDYMTPEEADTVMSQYAVWRSV